MPTVVGKQKTETGVLTQAVKLEMDCVAAYHQASVTLKDPGLSDTFEVMENDCKRHIALYQARLSTLKAPHASRNPISAPLNRFKVKVGGLFGLSGIHRAIKNNPVDCNTAYHRVAGRKDLKLQTRDLARSFIPDAQKHARWVEGLATHADPVKAH